MVLVVDLEGVGQDMLAVPIKAECLVPKVRINPSEFLDFNNIFLRHPKTLELELINEDNLRALCEAVQREEADFGVAFDGDGDRLAIVTGSGRIVRSDILLMVFAQDVVSRNPGADVVFDVKCSRNLTQLITSHGGRPVL